MGFQALCFVPLTHDSETEVILLLSASLGEGQEGSCLDRMGEGYVRRLGFVPGEAGVRRGWLDLQREQRRQP